MGSDLDQEILKEVATTLIDKDQRKRMKGFFWTPGDDGKRKRLDFAKLTDTQVGGGLVA